MSEDQTVMRFADAELLAELVALLPPFFVNVRQGESGGACPYVNYLVALMIERALCEGYTIDRTNEDGPLSQWDGWLRIETPDAPTFLQIAKPGGGTLEN